MGDRLNERMNDRMKEVRSLLVGVLRGSADKSEALLRLCAEVGRLGNEKVTALTPDEGRDLGHALHILSILCLGERPKGLSTSSTATCQKIRETLMASGEEVMAERKRVCLDAVMCLYRGGTELRDVVRDRGMLMPLMASLMLAGRQEDMKEVTALAEAEALVADLMSLQKGQVKDVVAAAGKCLTQTLLREDGLKAFIKASHNQLGNFPAPFAHRFSAVLATPPQGATHDHVKKLSLQAVNLLLDASLPDDWAGLLLRLLHRLWKSKPSQVLSTFQAPLLQPLYALTCEAGLEGNTLPASEKLNKAIRLLFQLGSYVPPGQRPLLFEHLRPFALLLFTILVQLKDSKFRAAKQLRASVVMMLRSAGNEEAVAQVLMQLVMEEPRPWEVYLPRPDQAFGVSEDAGLWVAEEELEEDDAGVVVRCLEARIVTGVGLMRKEWGGTGLLSEVMAECLMRVCEAERAEVEDEDEAERVLKAEQLLVALVDGWEEELVKDPAPALNGCKRLLRRVVDAKDGELGRRTVPLIAGVIGAVSLSLGMGGLGKSLRTKLEQDLKDVAELSRAAEKFCRDGGTRLSELLVGMEELVSIATASSAASEEASRMNLDEAIKELDSPLPSTRGHCLIEIGRLAREHNEEVGERFEKVLERVVKAVREEDPYVFLNAIRCLVALGGWRADPVTDALVGLFLGEDDETSIFRLKVGEALCQLLGELKEMTRGDIGRKMLGGFLSLCREGQSQEVRGSALSCLGRLGEEGWAVVGSEIEELWMLVESGLVNQEAMVRSGAAALVKGLAKGGKAELATATAGGPGRVYKQLVRLWAEDDDPAVRLNAQTRWKPWTSASGST